MGLFSSKCSNCGSKEHIGSDCPHGIFSSKCSNCGSTEHTSSGCPHGIFSSKCSNCGSVDHASANCPHGIFSSNCSNCGSTEHSGSECPHGIFSSECSNCGSRNHKTADCPHGLFASTTTREHEFTPSSSSSDDSGCGLLIGILVLGFVVIWLAVNVVLPVILLNSALILTILALSFKKHKTLFSIAAIAGAVYLLLDVTNGWFSTIFIQNVVKNPDWISGFVYLNATAIGISTWLLAQPIWVNAKQVDVSNQGKKILLRAISVLLVVLGLIATPLLYHSIPNQFVSSSFGFNQANSRNTLQKRTLKKDTPQQTVKYGIVSGSDVIIRQSHTTNSKIIGSVQNSGENVEILDNFSSPNNEETLIKRDVRVYVNGKEYHLSKGKSVSILSTNLNQATVSFMDKSLKAHKTLINTNYLEILTNTVWYKVKRNNGEIGWIFGKFITPDLSDGGQLAVITDADGYTNLRKGKGTNYPIVRKINSDEKFIAYPSDEKWWLIKMKDGTTGYMFHNRLDLLNRKFYIINVATTKTETNALVKEKKLKAQGYDVGHLWIPNYKSLSGAKFYSVYIGPFSTQRECERKTQEYRKINSSAYGLLVSQENKRVEIRGIGKVKVTELK